MVQTSSSNAVRLLKVDTSSQVIIALLHSIPKSTITKFDNVYLQQYYRDVYAGKSNCINITQNPAITLMCSDKYVAKTPQGTEIAQI